MLRKGDMKDKHIRIWKAFDREQIEKMRNPDIVLVEPGAGPVKWVDIISTIEVKWRDQPELFQKAIGQLGDVVALVFYHQQNHHWFPCLSLCGPSLCMSVFTHGGSRHTVLLDLHKLEDIFNFTKVMDYFVQAGGQWLGYDYCFFVQQGQWWDAEAREWEAQEQYETIGKLFISTGLYGKGTRVFAVKEMYSRTPRHAVIKDCWDPSETVSDEHVHKKLQDRDRDKSIGGRWYSPAVEHSERVFAERINCHSYTDPWDDAEFLQGITIMEKAMQP
ncbi:hypothetical protein DFH29DRAFT_1005655 [Suillus ampliporus]|nr:hypothetical protein DFH29DRAFT_1005655 [Suillus ampliporus]